MIDPSTPEPPQPEPDPTVWQPHWQPADPTDPYGEQRLQRLMMFLYLVPGFGLFPAFWTLLRRQGSHRQRQVSRIAVLLGLIWFVTYGALGLGAEQMGDITRFRLLFLDGMATTGYVVLCLSLMLRVWQNKSVQLPGISQFLRKSDR